MDYTYMEKFSCTHITESGIYIPNANTTIVQYAELFAPTQLYQLVLVLRFFFILSFLAKKLDV